MTKYAKKSYTVCIGETMLSAKQKQILELVKQNPQITLAELAKAVGLKSVSTVHVHIRKLIKENFLERKGHSLISTNRAVDEFTPIPFYGFAQCGDTDIFAEENIVDYVNMPTKFLPTPTQDLFFIKAKGDSMEPSISEGDLLMFRKTSELPPVGSVVLCRRADGLKIKRLGQYNTENGPSYRLVSDNKAKYEPFPADASVEILAKLVRMN